MYTLGLVAIFKNESVILKEWLDHYIYEGVDRFYLINNGSTDNFFEIIKDYSNIVLVNDTKKHSQTELYNKHFYNICKCECKWTIICDLDEFIYSRKDYNKISDYLNSLNEFVYQVKIPWKMFGSNGQIKQPNNVIKKFRKRELYLKEKLVLCKSIINMKYCTRFDIHESHVVNKANNILCNNDKDTDNIYANCITSEKILNDCYIHCNHYQLQSLEWFLKVKMTRGAADQSINVRNINYFKMVDKNSNQIKDLELLRKVY